jgi:light-regulated signal transduction histidine kinase (bacteriophytochrome)
MTEHEQVKSELRSYARRLEASNEEWEQFAHVVSHDLQKPIRMVNTYVQMVRDRYGDELPEQAHEHTDYAVEGAHRMRELIRGLLAYSRVDTERQSPERVDPNEVLDEIENSPSVRISETGVEIIREDLPAVKADRTQLSQVLQNLVENVIKFTPADRKPRVEVTAHAKTVRCGPR